jgi:hypothetical protein
MAMGDPGFPSTNGGGDEVTIVPYNSQKDIFNEHYGGHMADMHLYDHF